MLIFKINNWFLGLKNIVFPAQKKAEEYNRCIWKKNENKKVYKYNVCILKVQYEQTFNKVI